MVEQIAPFWKGRTYHEALNKALPAEVHKLTYDDPDGLISRFIVNETSSFRSSIQWVHDYEVVLKRGFNGLKQEMEEKLAALDPASPVDQVDKRPFIEATILVCDAIVLWAKRHADAARKAAEGKDYLSFYYVTGSRLLRSRSVPVLHPDVLPSGTEDRYHHLQRPYGPVLLSLLQEGHGSRHPDR